MDELPVGTKLWLEGLLRDQTFWQVVTMVILLIILVLLWPHLDLHLGGAALR